MRISYLASAALAVSFLPLASPAYAGSNSQGITYGSGSYTASSHASHSMSTRYSSGSTSSCPSGSTRSSDGFCISAGSSSSVGVSNSTSSASVGYTSPPSMAPAMGGTSSASVEYTSPPSMAPSVGRGSSTIVPFQTSVNNISSLRIDGMGSNEFLSETSCPTSVYNPGGAKVLGCYSVVKPVPAPVYRPAPVVVPQTYYQQVRVVRPIIYVRYPVPTPVPVPIYQYNYQVSGCGMAYSRYGNNWPRMGSGCGW